MPGPLIELRGFYSAEEEHDEDEHGHEEEGPTLFVNDAFESGFTFDLVNGDTYDHKLVLNLVDEDTSIIGSEAFMNPASSDELTLGYFITQDFNLFHVGVPLGPGAVREGFHIVKHSLWGTVVDSLSFVSV